MLHFKTSLETSYVMKITFTKYISPSNIKCSIKNKKTFTGSQIAREFFIGKTRNFICLTHLLTTFASIEAKQSSTKPPFYATITNSLVGCAFWSSEECVPSVPCLFFYLQSGCLSSSSSNETISRHYFSISTLSLSSIIDATNLFKVLRLCYCTEVPVLESYTTCIFTVGHKITPIFYVLSIYRLRPLQPHPFYDASYICDHTPSSW